MEHITRLSDIMHIKLMRITRSRSTVQRSNVPRSPVPRSTIQFPIKVDFNQLIIFQCGYEDIADLNILSHHALIT